MTFRLMKILLLLETLYNYITSIIKELTSLCDFPGVTLHEHLNYLFYLPIRKSLAVPSYKQSGAYGKDRWGMEDQYHINRSLKTFIEDVSSPSNVPCRFAQAAVLRLQMGHKIVYTYWYICNTSENIGLLQFCISFFFFFFSIMNMKFIESENGIALKHFSCFLTFGRYFFHYKMILYNMELIQNDDL